MSQKNDLISRQAVLYAIVNNPSEEIRQQWIGRNSQEAYLTGGAHRQLEIIDLIDKLPTVQPERKKGKWLRYGEDGYPNNEDTVFWQRDQCLEQYTGRTKRIPNFRPNCGADMRKDEEHDE